ncbi:binding-protein-dependent transport systems inner membrane component [Methanohalobium evestigatum Z-7303]|uniref:Binding-protein-dependent transport systems inner membrane component n=1 Tax=Methanohalobium evestigatum (strain ATCC BAA-1072 / DSM 3721 / NBRC 107634 / OCM 161 / Z-7303) TaxID=644295 RepID=D7EAQ3_METEZ|nr:ABC transporter permease [Methanohalobium evestigatum]ADI75052.1 binding-protein-dependent transport systems inner membrane component [Methanohalobium evestigatum Z-7303]
MLGVLNDIIQVWQTNSLTMRTIEHLYMFSIALFISSVIGVVLGITIYYNSKLSNPVLNILNIFETTPDIALLVILLPIAGMGTLPTIIASILYSLLPITRNTYTGLKGVDRKYINIARALGLSSREILFKIRIPMSLPLIAGGIRIALVFTMGLVTLGGLIAAGGLGTTLQTGIQLYEVNTILLAGIWTGLLAVILDGFAGMVEKRLNSRYETW